MSNDSEKHKAMVDAADAIEELICEVADEHNARLDAEERQRWVPVAEALPEEKTPVQVTYLGYHDKKPHTDMIACLYCGYWCYWDGAPCSYNKCRVEVTHWMPPPQPPEEENT